MNILGNKNKNVWCVFCKHWYNPSSKGVTPRKGSRELYDVDKSLKCHCSKSGLITPACSNCRYFERR